MLGLKAKEKRDKDAMQRPPSRLGTRSGDRAGTPASIPVMALYHLSLPGEAGSWLIGLPCAFWKISRMNKKNQLMVC